MTSNDFKMTSKDDDKPVSKKVKSKNSLRGGDPRVENEISQTINKYNKESYST